MLIKRKHILQYSLEDKLPPIDFHFLINLLTDNFFCEMFQTDHGPTFIYEEPIYMFFYWVTVFRVVWS